MTTLTAAMPPARLAVPDDRTPITVVYQPRPNAARATAQYTPGRDRIARLRLAGSLAAQCRAHELLLLVIERYDGPAPIPCSQTVLAARHVPIGHGDSAIRTDELLLFEAAQAGDERVELTAGVFPDAYHRPVALGYVPAEVVAARDARRAMSASE